MKVQSLKEAIKHTMTMKKPLSMREINQMKKRKNKKNMSSVNRLSRRLISKAVMMKLTRRVRAMKRKRICETTSRCPRRMTLK